MPGFFDIFATRKGRLATGRGVEKVGPEVISATLKRATEFLTAEVHKRTPRGAFSILAGSIAPEVRGRGATITGTVGTPLIYGRPVETGTRPHFPPPDALVPWVQRKLGLGLIEAESAAWAIARAISRRGTKGAHMFARALKEEGRKLDAILDEIVPGMVAELES